VQSCSVEDALCAIGQMMASMGSADQRLVAPHMLEYHLSQQHAGWHRLDPAPGVSPPPPSV
jgi:alcohol dehydrogenase class IV